jgi:hypothetical protein
VIREWVPASERGVANAIFGAGAAAGWAIGAVATLTMTRRAIEPYTQFDRDVAKPA